jgi:voltage-gated sodium channel
MAARAAAVKATREREKKRKLKEEEGASGEPSPVDTLAPKPSAEPEVNPQRAPDWALGIREDGTTGGGLCFRPYLVFSRWCHELAYGEHEANFNGFILFIIVLAGVVVGLQTYPSMESSKGIGWLNFVILIIFIIEVVVKLGAMGLVPVRYFTGPDKAWNNFDFFIVAASLPGVGSLLFGGGAGGVVVLRLLRLARVVKIINKIPKLKMIIMGLVGGLKSIGYILLLLFLVFYMFAIMGFFFFARNDPYHFDRLSTSLLTLWRASTLEDWTDIMYISIWGCDRYTGGIYIQKDDPAIKDVAWHFRCLHPYANPGVTVVYWVFFITIASFVMLSLFIGVVTLAMNESLEQMKEDSERAKKEKLMERKRKLMAASSSSRNLSPGGDGGEIEGDGGGGGGSGGRPFSEISTMRACLKNANDAMLVPLERQFSDGGGDTKGLSACGQWWLSVSARSMALAESTWFSTTIVICIVIAGCELGIEAQEYAVHPEQHEGNDAGGMPYTIAGSHGGSTFMQAIYVDYAINLIFSLELILKVVGEGFEPWNFMRGGWNQLDFIIVAGSWLPAGSGGPIKILRLLRLLRILKLISRVPDLAIIINSLISGFESIGFILLIMFVLFYLFAILAIILFSENDPYHFGSLHASMLSLFRICTFEDWTDIMYTNVYGCNRGGYSPYPLGKATDKDRHGVGKCMEDEDAVPVGMGVLAAFYFVFFSIISAMVLLTLFIGVISTAMEEAQEKNKEKQIVLKRLKKLQKHFSIPPLAVSNWTKFFNMLDLDESGTLDMDEISSGFDCVYYSSDQSLKLLQKVCENGEIELDKYVHYMYSYSQHLLGNEIPIVFDSAKKHLLYGDDLNDFGIDSPGSNSETNSVFSERTFASRAGIGGESMTPERVGRGQSGSTATRASPMRQRAVPKSGVSRVGSRSQSSPASSSRNGSRNSTPDAGLASQGSSSGFGHRR